MKKRLLILAFVFGIGLCGVGGFYYWLDMQVPKGDQNFAKEPAAPDEKCSQGADDCTCNVKSILLDPLMVDHYG